jgi:hypothetical protein
MVGRSKDLTFAPLPQQGGWATSPERAKFVLAISGFMGSSFRL